MLRLGVPVTARHGTFTDAEYGLYAPDGALIPIYQSRPAWIIRFSGSGVVDTGDEIKPGTHQPTAINHEENIVIDAATGKFLEVYTYR